MDAKDWASPSRSAFRSARHLISAAASASYSTNCIPRPARQSRSSAAVPQALRLRVSLPLFGHKPTVFEKYSRSRRHDEPGNSRIRLPRDIIRKEIEQIELLGVEILCNQNIGVDVTVEELHARFDAVVVAAGTLDPNIIDIPGKDLAGIHHGLDFLLEANETEQFDIGKRVVVIGGGFTAMDCARTALRLNSDAAIYYRRSREEMSVPADELKEVEHEAIPIEIMAGPVAYLGNGHGLEQMRFIRNELGEPDDSGRRRPVASRRQRIRESTSTRCCWQQASGRTRAGSAMRSVARCSTKMAGSRAANPY